MINTNYKKIACIYIGKIKYQTRLLKQIKLLMHNDYAVTAFTGSEIYYDELKKDSNIENFNFDIINKDIKYGRKIKFLTFINQLVFNIKIGKRIADSSFGYVLCEELTCLLAGVVAKKINPEIKLIFDNTELSIERYNGMKYNIFYFLQKKCLPYCDYIIHTEKKRMKYFVDKYKLYNNNQILIENFPELNKSSRNINKNRNIINVIYMGAITPDRSVQSIIKAFIDFKNINLDIVGFGDSIYIKQLKDLLINNNILNVRILDPVPYDKIFELLDNYSIGIATYKNNNLNNYYCAPNKIYQYIHSGLAVIANDYPGLIDVIDKHKIGCCIKNVDSVSLKDAINKIIDNEYFNNITNEIKERFSWESQTGEYMKIFSNDI